MDNFPSNAKPMPGGKPKPPREEKPPIKKIVTGEVKLRKKPLGKRITETFFNGDAKGAAAYVLTEVIIPNTKDLAVEAFTQGLERIVYGDNKPVSRRSNHVRNAVNVGHTAYQRFSQPTQTGRRDEGRPMSRRGRATFDFGEIVLDSRAEATDVVDQMFELISKFECATVADLYEMVGVTGSTTDTNWGWTDFRGAGVQRVNGGYLLDLPRPEPLD